MDNVKIKNKKLLAIIGAIILGVVLCAVILFFLFGNNNQEEKLTKELKTLGISFYEDFYYNQIGSTKEEKVEYLSKYKDMGIKISLNKMIRTNVNESEEISSIFINEETNKECDKNNSLVTIYPKEPFGKSDYTIEVTLVCGF